MYIAPGQGTEIPYYFSHLLPVNKKNKSLWSLIFTVVYVCFLFFFFFFSSFFFFFFSYVYRPMQYQTTYDNRKAFSLCPYVASFKIISSKSDFTHIFNEFIHARPGPRAEIPFRTNFGVNRKPLSLRPFVESFKRIFEFWFYTHFLSTCI